MNLLNYIDILHSELETLNKKQLIELLTQTSKDLPESKRDNLLNKIENLKEPQIQEAQLWPQEMRDRYNEIKEILNKINSGEIDIQRKDIEDGFEYYSYNDWEDDFPTYLDDKKFIEAFEQLKDFLKECINKAYYYRGYKLGLKILSLKVDYVTSCGDVDTESLTELLKQDDELNFDFDSILLNTLIGAFLKNKNNIDRSKSIYKVYLNANTVSVSLEDLFQNLNIGTEEFKTFLKAFIVFIKKQSGTIADELINEALSLSENYDEYLELALNTLNSSPIIFADFINNKVHNFEEKYNLILKALDLIEEPNLFGSDLARFNLSLIFDQEISSKPSEVVDKLLFDMFRFNPNIVNFLIAYCDTSNSEKMKERLEKFINDSKSEDIKKYLIFYQFFLGKFNIVLNDINLSDIEYDKFQLYLCLSCLFLFYLSQDPEHKENSLIILNLLCDRSCLFSLINQCGFRMNYSETLISDMVNGLDRWRQKQKLITPDFADKILVKIKPVIMKEIQSILDNHERSQYEEAAILLKAYAEVLYQQGLTNSVDETIDKYREPYKRYSSFLRELKKLGYRS